VSESSSYKHDLETTVRTFRPVLKALNLREPEKYRSVYLSEFDHLDVFNLKFCSIRALFADMEEDCAAALATQYTDGLLRNYIIFNRNILKDCNKERIKIMGVHEFCHFMAIIFAILARTFDIARTDIIKRLNNKVDKLKKNELDMLYSILSKKEPPDYRELELLTDSHFRLGFEGDVPDYIELFRYFMFSKEIFDITFNEEKQTQFKILMRTGKNESVEKAVDLLIESLEIAANEKSVPFQMAFHQLKRWAHMYV
jgi:hypothetical protein